MLHHKRHEVIKWNVRVVGLLERQLFYGLSSVHGLGGCVLTVGGDTQEKVIVKKAFDEIPFRTSVNPAEGVGGSNDRP
jgi:hypothetical protein